MTSLNLQKLLIQQEDCKERILILWGRICAGQPLTHLLVTELEGLVREHSLLSQIHLHAVANGTVPASLLHVLEEMEKHKAAQAAEMLPGLEPETQPNAQDS